MALSKIGLVGCGILGGKIAENPVTGKEEACRDSLCGYTSVGPSYLGDFAYHGLEVWVYDQNNEVLDSLVVRLKYDKEKLWKDKLMMQTDFVGNVYYMNKLERVAKKSKFIFECVNEDLKIKQDVIERISHCCSPDAIIASSTMNLKLDEVFAKAVHPERCIGVRFLSPVYCIPEVELTLSSVTSNETLTKVQVFLGNMGKIPYFRTRNEAHLLTNEEKEARRIGETLVL
ncbi:uncharacterized protein LOC111089317, partial [Limulus polyphemus]|uniref:Uncharacterized protein LOC111089317 n=1 Tax=Limulus polyphemus TaxID=6850 RepID=A0ABM1TN45_LIMPO